jgi:DNA-binding SARP family transcriptional activator
MLLDNANTLDPDALQRLTLLRRAMELYGGNFLPSDADEAWVVNPRLKLRAAFTRIVEELGRSLELSGRWDEARTVYQRGVEADELIEEFYAGLMRCYRATNRHAEGLAVYRRLRQTLSLVLGVAPSLECDAMADALRKGA